MFRKMKITTFGIVFTEGIILLFMILCRISWEVLLNINLFENIIFKISFIVIMISFYAILLYESLSHNKWME